MVCIVSTTNLGGLFKMRKILILLSVLAFAALANAQWQSVVGSPHDLSSTGGAPSQ